MSRFMYPNFQIMKFQKKMPNILFYTVIYSVFQFERSFYIFANGINHFKRYHVQNNAQIIAKIQTNGRLRTVNFGKNTIATSSYQHQVKLPSLAAGHPYTPTSFIRRESCYGWQDTESWTNVPFEGGLA